MTISRRELFGWGLRALAVCAVMTPEASMAAVLGSKSDRDVHLGMPGGNSTIVTNRTAWPIHVFDHRGKFRVTVAPYSVDSVRTLYDFPWEKHAHGLYMDHGVVTTSGAATGAHVNEHGRLSATIPNWVM